MNVVFHEIMSCFQRRTKANLFHIKFLGIQVGKNMRNCWFDQHRNRHSCKGLSCTFDLPWTRRLPLTSEEALSAHASIIATSLMYGISRANMKKLQRVQNALIRVICSLGPRDSVSGARRDLHWLPIEQRIIFKIAVLTFNCRQRSALPYLCDLVHDYRPRRALRSGDGATLEVPRTKTVTAGACFQRRSANHLERPSSQIETVYILQWI